MLPPAQPTFVPPAQIQSDPSSRHLEILGLPPQPFLPENIYLAATIPTRDLIEHFTFVNHCRYILQNRVERQINHSLTELHRLTPHPIIFAGFLWRYRIIINQTGILEDYRRIVRTSSIPEGAALQKGYTVYYSWDGKSYTITLDDA